MFVYRLAYFYYLEVKEIFYFETSAEFRPTLHYEYIIETELFMFVRDDFLCSLHVMAIHEGVRNDQDT
jgi:hypothetical protein